MIKYNEKIGFGYIQHLISEKKINESIEILEYFTENVDDKELLSKSFLELGKIKIENDFENYNDIISDFKKAKEYSNKKNYGISLHYYALSNSFVIQKIESNQNNNEAISKYLIEAIKAYTKSINCNNNYALEDLLKCITLIFKYNHIKSVEETIIDNIKQIPTNFWVKVLPQLLARVSSKQTNLNIFIQDILSKICKYYY
jgi:FKBP12-rapamycin complex-associated protein